MATKVRSKKFFIGVKDNRFEDRRQSSILSLVTDGSEIYLNQYGKTFTVDELGNFNVIKVADQSVLEFTPIDGRNNEYSYSFLSYDTKQNISTTDSYTFGNTAKIETDNLIVGSGSSAIISSISTNFTSEKILIDFISNNGNYYEYGEINLISNGITTSFSEFSKITVSNDDTINRVGLGTFDIDNNNLVFYSNISEDLICNLVSVSIANTEYTFTSSSVLKYGEIESQNVGIASSTSPDPEVISSYTSNYHLAYFLVQITDTTNGDLQLSEIVVLNNGTQTTLIEYGNLYTNGPLGEFDSNTSSITELVFTPIPNINVDITLLRHIISYEEFSSSPTSINFGNAELSTGMSKFQQSSDAAFKKDFELTHKNIPIFERVFNGSQESTSINPASVDLNNNLIYLPNHFFVSGEEIEYRSENYTFSDILVASTTQISGVGTNIVYVDDLFGLESGDYLSVPGQSYLVINDLGSNYVSLASTISLQINSGIAVTFSRALESGDFQSTFNSIGIEETYISGVGNTDKLSGNLYVYKFDNQYIGITTSPIDALSDSPKLIDFTSVGIGNRHYITSKKQNTKAVILIDNVIQSPIVSTAITSLLLDDIDLLDTTLEFSGITSFFSGDLIKVDDEIMKVSSVSVGDTAFVEVQRPLMGTGLSTHSSNTLITKMEGNYNIVGSTIYFAEAPYGPIYDEEKGDINIRSSFQGRAFIRSGIPNSNKETYTKNYIFDDISSKFDAVKKDFNLTSEENNVSGISTSNSIILINNIFQSPENDYNLSEDLSQTELNFTGTATSALYDPNNASVPRGGIIVSVGSSDGFGYQPLVSAGGTAIVSIAGTIQSISIGNSGSGYRIGVQPIVRVGVQTLSGSSPNIEFIGTATVLGGHIVSVAITNPGSGYTSTNPPKVVFDNPLSYSNLDLIYQSPNTGIGSQAKIDIVVGQGSSVIDFKIKNYGYSYNVGDILTVQTGGTSGIPTNPSLSFEPFSIIVNRTYQDEFSGWSIGELQKIDDIDHLFNGFRKTFPISDNRNRFAIIKKEGSNIDLSATLLIFVNDVLQEPNVSYVFDGGSLIEFLEAPKSGSKCRILFYKGTPGVDVIDVDIEETIKTGDTVRITNDDYKLTENRRLVRDIILPDTLETNPYNSIGITSNTSLQRPIIWCKQRNDTIIDGIGIGKDRLSYESRIFPSSNIINSVGVGSTQIFVDNVKTIFDAENENTLEYIRNSIEIIDNRKIVQSIGTAIVSISGTIQSIDIINGGYGYDSNPIVAIQNPIGIGSTGRAILTSQINAGIVTEIYITSPGFGYTYTNPPLVYIEPPKQKSEYIEGVSYKGDFGIITGIKTTSVGFASTALIFDVFIPSDSYLRNESITDPVITQTGLLENYYFKVSNSKIGSGVTSLRKDGSIIGIGTTGIDNIYQVISVSFASTDVYGEGNDIAAQVTVSISSYDGLTGFGYSNYYGDYSWGVIEVPKTQNEYMVNSNYGVVGLNTTPLVRRYNYLRYINYNPI
jgi:hypothetical protein